MSAAYIHGHFDIDGGLFVGNDGVLNLWIGGDSIEKLDNISKVTPYPSSVHEVHTEDIFNFRKPRGAYYMMVRGSNAIEMCNWMYTSVTSKDAYKMLEMMNIAFGHINTFQFVKKDINAFAPVKAHVTDTGFDLWLLKKISEDKGVIMYDTCIAVQPPHGFYFDLVGRSSIAKTGHMLANNIGIIDQGYQGTVKVALVKTSPEVPDLELPAKVVQLVPRSWHHMIPLETSEFNGPSLRGEGGFGSTNE